MMFFIMMSYHGVYMKARIELFIFFICLIPDWVHKNFQYGIQVRHEDEQKKYKYRRDSKECNFNPENRDNREYSWDNKRKNDKNERQNNCSEIDKKKGKIEMKSHFYVMYCHMGWSRKCFKCLLSFKDDKIWCISKEHIHHKCKEEVYPHSCRNISKIVLSKYAKEEYIKSYDGYQFKNREEVLKFKQREKIRASSKESGYSRDWLFFFSLWFIINHNYHASFGNRSNNHIEEKYAPYCDDCFIKIAFMDEIIKHGKKLIFFIKELYIGKSNLIENNKREPESSKKSRKKIKLFNRCSLYNSLPCGYHNIFSHKCGYCLRLYQIQEKKCPIHFHSKFIWSSSLMKLFSSM